MDAGLRVHHPTHDSGFPGASGMQPFTIIGSVVRHFAPIVFCILISSSAHATEQTEPRAGLEKTAAESWVIPAKETQAVKETLRAVGAAAKLVFQRASIRRDHIVVRFGKAVTGQATLHVTLVHPSVASDSARRLERLAIESRPGPAPAPELDALVKALKGAGQQRDWWKEPRTEPRSDIDVAVLPVTTKAAGSQPDAADGSATLEAMRRAWEIGNDEELRAILDIVQLEQLQSPAEKLEFALAYARVGRPEKVRLISETFSESSTLWGHALRGDLESLEVVFKGKNPSQVCQARSLGEILFKAGHDAKAEGFLRGILQRSPDCMYAAELLTHVLIKLKRGKDAIDTLKPHQEKHPEDTRLNITLSHAYRLNGDLKEAIHHFHLAADGLAKEKDSRYLGQILGLYLQDQDEQYWAEHWRKVLKTKPDYIIGRFLLGACLHYMNEFEESSRHLEMIKDVIRSEPRWYIYRAMNDFNLGDSASARQLLEEAARLPSVDADVYYCRAEVTRDTERDGAISDLERYLALTGRSHFENPEKRLRVTEMRDALVRCQKQRQAVCDGPWEHPRSVLLDRVRRYWDVALLAILCLAAIAGVARFRRPSTGS
jgi:Flp pilus assembly protein TadD